MAKSRERIPNGLRDQVLNEFNHRCATCGKERPHLHHIDENPSNNHPANLIPLCPSCHLIDQHNPTAPMDPAKLGLFRRYKDPKILHPGFEPLFRRLSFLDVVDNNSPTDIIAARSDELTAFVGALQMGEF